MRVQTEGFGRGLNLDKAWPGVAWNDGKGKVGQGLARAAWGHNQDHLFQEGNAKHERTNPIQLKKHGPPLLRNRPTMLQRNNAKPE